MKTKKNINCQSPTPVTSKYFTNRVGMDDSFTDFQEPKKCSKGPKTIKICKEKVKKGKKLKGQCDIRSVLRNKKNELISYNKDFNEICREGGVDVDAEQLQIAIAMSKSLKQNQVETNSSSKVSAMSTQERCNKIRTTLLEYGFHVPDIKIGQTKKRGIQKPSKLLLMSDDHKQQLISDKYSQILFNIKSNPRKINENPAKKCFVFDICTNTPYENLKNEKIFYIQKLFQPSTSNICHLLKDWSKIPGRPISPIKKETYDLKFSDVAYKQEELDVILSGRLTEAKHIVRLKQNFVRIDNQSTLNITSVHSSAECIKYSFNNESQLQINSSNGDTLKNMKEINDIGKDTLLRSLSPDMFDDSEIVDNVNQIQQECISIEKFDLPPSQPSIKNKNDDFMDLTECIKPSARTNLLEIIEIDQPVSQNSENHTRRHSNDFMDLTQCIKPILNMPQIIEESIDLTQNSNENKVVNDSKCGGVAIDLTQSSDSNDSTLPYVDLKDTISVKKTNKSVLSDVDIEKHVSLGCKNITDTGNVVSSRGSSEISLFDDFVYSHSENSSKSSTKSCKTLSKNISNIDKEMCMESTYHSISSEDNMYDSTSSAKHFEETEKEMINLKDESGNTEECCNITNSDLKNTYSYNYSLKNSMNISNLGKYNNESIDYGEITQNKNEFGSFLIKSPAKPNKTVNDLMLSTSSQPSNEISSSQCSTNDVVFEISDEELDYSMHKSKCYKEYPSDDYKETNIKNNSNYNNTCKTNLQNSVDISLPAVEIKGTKVKIKSADETLNAIDKTPVKKLIDESAVSIETPKNSDYIIKTNNVTPMVNFETLSTPEVNQELNKYGLKPFKRKRAIQLLQHLYDQTHPMIENCIQDETFRKRFKSDINELVIHKDEPCNSNMKLQDNLKTKPEVKGKLYEVEELNEKENVSLYEVTEDLPDFRDVCCDPKDWVFQKRERAKLHSCRVPLHIVFHNYVSCRRRLKQAILCYQPVQIDIIHKQLVGYGYRFDPKDLLRYMDKKCITVKTSDNNARNIKQGTTK